MLNDMRLLELALWCFLFVLSAYTIGVFIKEKGYKEGWAANQYRNKFSTWPDGLRKVAKQPSLSVRSYVRSRQIAYAKAKAKAEGYKEMGKRSLY